jgi:hypothetical protein
MTPPVYRKKEEVQMARRKARVRARSGRPGANGVGMRNRAGVRGGRADASMIPRVLTGAVEGIEIVAVGTLQLARDVVVSAVSGAANIGAEALTATTAGVRGVLSASAQLVGDVATTAQSTLLATIDNARRSGRASARLGSMRPAALTQQAGENVTSASSPKMSRSRRGRLRPVTAPASTSTAA